MHGRFIGRIHYEQRMCPRPARSELPTRAVGGALRHEPRRGGNDHGKGDDQLWQGPLPLWPTDKADSPEAFLSDTPTAVLVRQVLGAVSQFEKASLVAKLAAARQRRQNG